MFSIECLRITYTCIVLACTRVIKKWLDNNSNHTLYNYMYVYNETHQFFLLKLKPYYLYHRVEIDTLLYSITNLNLYTMYDLYLYLNHICALLYYIKIFDLLTLLSILHESSTCSFILVNHTLEPHLGLKKNRSLHRVLKKIWVFFWRAKWVFG